MIKILSFMLGTSVVLSGESLNASRRSVHLEIGTEPGQFTTVIACFIYDDDPQEWLFSFFNNHCTYGSRTAIRSRASYDQQIWHRYAARLTRIRG